jgi:dolichol-phosphate mannosyltransferase
MPRIAAIIPVYQGASMFDELAGEVTRALARLTPDFEILFVDDGSTDDGWVKIERAAAADTRIRGLRLIRNFGEHVAITVGIDHVDADRVVIMACDLQDDPAAIERMMQKADEGFDLVLVRRMQRKDAPLKRALARIFYGVISLLLHVDYDYRVGNFRLLSRDAVDYLRQHRERQRNVNAIVALMGLRTAYVDVIHRPRRQGKSTYTLWRSVSMAASVVLGYSEIPLLLSGLIGAALGVASVAWAAALGLRAWGGGPVSQTALVLAGGGAVAGLLLVNLGIVGAYLGRAATEARGRPMYFVSATAGPVKRAPDVTR